MAEGLLEKEPLTLPQRISGGTQAKAKESNRVKGKGREGERGRLSLGAKRRGRECRIFAATGGDGGGGGRGGPRRGTRCWQPGALFPALAFAGKLRAFFLPH